MRVKEGGRFSEKSPSEAANLLKKNNRKKAGFSDRSEFFQSFAQTGRAGRLKKIRYPVEGGGGSEKE